MKFLKNKHFYNVVNNIFITLFIALFFCCVLSILKNFDLTEIENKDKIFTQYKNKDIKLRLREIQELCGPGYAVGWWKFYEFDLTLKNIDIFTHAKNKLYPVDGSVFSIKEKRLNDFYNKPHKISNGMFEYVKNHSSDNLSANSYYCGNIKKCTENDNGIISGMIHASFIGSKKGNIANNFLKSTAEEIHYLFKQTNYPIIDLTYNFVAEKQQRYGEEIYHFFHITRLDYKNNSCNKKIALELLNDLSRGLN